MIAKAIYKNGYLELEKPLALTEGAEVNVHVIPINSNQEKRKLGLAKGKVWVAEDFKNIPEEFDEYVK